MPSIKPIDSVPRILFVLWIGCFLAGCSFSLVMPFLPRFIASLGVTENLYTWSGMTYAASYLASAVMSPIWGNMADRYGRKPMIIRSGIAITIVYVLMSLVNNPYQLFALRLANGAFAGFVPSSIALVATIMPEHMVGRGLALISTGVAAGNISGPMIGGFLSDIFSIRATMQIGAAMIFAATILVIAAVKEKVTAQDLQPTSPMQDLRTAISHPHLAAIFLSTMMIAIALQSMEPILTAFVPTLHREAFLTWAMVALLGRSDANAFASGFIYGLPGIAMILFAARWSRLGGQIGYNKVLTIGLLGASLLAMPQSLVTTAGGLIVLRFAYGMMTAAVQPALNATLANSVHPSFRGRAFGINHSAMQIGAVIGATSGGLVADWFGKRAVFLFTGMLLLATCGWVYRSLVKRSPPTEMAGDHPINTPST